MQTNEITRRIIGSAYDVQFEVGPGLLESAYSPCMALEMAPRDLRFSAQHPLPLVYRGRHFGCGCCPDFLVEDCIIVELKSVTRLKPVFTGR